MYMSRNNRYRSASSRTSGRTEETADYEIALRLHAEMNHPPIPTTSAGESTEYTEAFDGDFELALQMQFNDSYEDDANGNKTNMPYAGHTREIPTRISSRAYMEAATEKIEKDSAVYSCDRLGVSSRGNFRSLADFTTYLRSARCPACWGNLLQSERDIIDIFQNWEIGDGGQLTSQITCKACQMSTCIACTSKISAGHSSLKVKGKEVSWCCKGGRLYVFWVLLCGFDQRFCAGKSKEMVKPVTNKRSQGYSEGPAIRGKKRHNKSRGNGVGFGGIQYVPQLPTSAMPMEYTSNFEGRMDSMPQHHHSNSYKRTMSNNKARVLSAQQAKDTFGSLILKLLTGLLPSLDRKHDFDVNPPDAIPNILLESKLFSYCAELLRNDSLDDACNREELYSELISFLSTIGSHYKTASLVFNERLVRPGTTNLLILSFQSVPSLSNEKEASLIQCLRNLILQSDLLLQGAKKHEKDFSTKNGRVLLTLCRRISELSQLLERNNTKDTTNDVAFSSDKSAACAITELPDDQILARYEFGTQARALKQAPLGRMKRLITEITTLNTALPPGIFVRHGSERPDILKVIIIGPSGTPYENGLFEFDFFCDSEYPNKPPQVRFQTTGGGRAAFNPNLYPCGKVCLSLLGTWQGEPWKPGESTLLQVLISLQAMILCEQPWYNEPGREIGYISGKENFQAVLYNREIRELTVRYAMLRWLEMPHTLWQDVVEQHFRKNADTILQTVSRWALHKISNPSNRDDVGDLFETPESGQKSFVRDLEQLNAALRKYGATYEIPETLRPNPQTESHHGLKDEPSIRLRGQHLSTPPLPTPSFPAPLFPAPPFPFQPHTAFTPLFREPPAPPLSFPPYETTPPLTGPQPAPHYGDPFAFGQPPLFGSTSGVGDISNDRSGYGLAAPQSVRGGYSPAGLQSNRGRNNGTGPLNGRGRGNESFPSSGRDGYHEALRLGHSRGTGPLSGHIDHETNSPNRHLYQTRSALRFGSLESTASMSGTMEDPLDSLSSRSSGRSRGLFEGRGRGGNSRGGRGNSAFRGRRGNL